MRRRRETHSRGVRCPDRHAVARMKDQKPRTLECLARDIELALDHIDRPLLLVGIKRHARARSKRHLRVEPFRERSHWRLGAESGTSNPPGPYTVVLDGREACGIKMLKRRVGFLLCLWKRDPALNSEETLAALARAQRAALGVRNAAPGGHEIHRPGGDLQRIALAVAVHDTAVETRVAHGAGILRL